jgi:hypothetical protein
VSDGAEVVHVQALVAKFSVEAFHEGVLDRLSGANEGKGNALLTGSGVEDLARELGAVVDDDDLGLAAQFDEAF